MSRTSSVKAFGVNIPVRRGKVKVDKKKAEICIPPTLLYKSKDGELVRSKTVTCSELDISKIDVDPEDKKLSVITEKSDEGSTEHKITDVD